MQYIIEVNVFGENVSTFLEKMHLKNVSYNNKIVWSNLSFEAAGSFEGLYWM